MPAQKLVDKHSLKILNMEPSNLPQNHSHQQLMSNGDDSDSIDTTVPTLTAGPDASQGRRGTGIRLRDKITVAVLFYVNLINYMDRFTVAGILQQIQTHYNIGDDKGGLLQTAFVLSYMVFAPVFGYLGDRYNRKLLMALGVLLWSGTTLAGSFVNSYHMFLTFRALVGIGEASYSTIAPTIISDLFVKDTRSKMLALFYFAIPVGSGLGYIIGSETARATGVWQWGLRVTPIMGAIAVILILLAMEDPMRGESEGRSDIGRTSWLQDIRALGNNASFMLSTLGFTCVAFVAGALAWWGPMFIHYGLVLQPGHENATLNDVSYKFGIVAMFSGLVGVPLGSCLAQFLRPRYPRVDPMICAIGLLISAPLLFIASLLAESSISVCYIFIFFGEVFLNLNWSVVADMLLYVVIPTRRSTAEAFQILLSHALGDAGSPYLIGVISEALKTALSRPDVSLHANSTILRNDTMILGVHETEDPVVRFKSLQYALFTTSFVEVVGGLFFLITALYIIRDRKKAELEHQGAEHPQPRHLFADD
ncbi:protein spinster [Schistocerca gregaria]|uniref:protein spinster n=1 Tax=Schistocerca gregaria TaxID=7010 RepID=UPI00211E4A32|nr:protein spinster [Schistocerca gregaria]